MQSSGKSTRNHLYDYATYQDFSHGLEGSLERRSDPLVLLLGEKAKLEFQPRPAAAARFFISSGDTSS
jgi:hypothetical protein